MNFNDCITPLLRHEGGYVNHPADPGGETKFGITIRRYPHLDIFNLTREQAIEIYRRDWWDKLKIDLLPPHIRYMVFDCAVNCGAGNAIKMLQRLAKVNADGIIGPVTAAAAAKVSIKDYATKRREYYQNLVYRKPSMRVFLLGWLRRVKDCEEFSLNYFTNPDCTCS
jgi:lysozyme family protein